LINCTGADGFKMGV